MGDRVLEHLHEVPVPFGELAWDHVRGGLADATEEELAGTGRTRATPVETAIQETATSLRRPHRRPAGRDTRPDLPAAPGTVSHSGLIPSTAKPAVLPAATTTAPARIPAAMAVSGLPRQNCWPMPQLRLPSRQATSQIPATAAPRAAPRAKAAEARPTTADHDGTACAAIAAPIVAVPGARSSP